MFFSKLLALVLGVHSRHRQTTRAARLWRDRPQTGCQAKVQALLSAVTGTPGARTYRTARRYMGRCYRRKDTTQHNSESRPDLEYSFSRSNKVPDIGGIIIMLPGRLLVVVAMLGGIHSAHAHGIAGNRFFPGTLSFDDPAVADEAIVANFSSFKLPNEGGNLVDNRFDWAFFRLLTPTLGIGINRAPINQGRDRRVDGFQRHDRNSTGII